MVSPPCVRKYNAAAGPCHRPGSREAGMPTTTSSHRRASRRSVPRNRVLLPRPRNPRRRRRRQGQGHAPHGLHRQSSSTRRGSAPEVPRAVALLRRPWGQHPCRRRDRCRQTAPRRRCGPPRDLRSRHRTSVSGFGVRSTIGLSTSFTRSAETACEPRKSRCSNSSCGNSRQHQPPSYASVSVSSAGRRRGRRRCDRGWGGGEWC